MLLRGARLAVLVHGCFWHGCPQHFHAPKANAAWWELKLESVQRRDADTLVQLSAAGWTPVVVWEHEDMVEVAHRLRRLVSDSAALRVAHQRGGAEARRSAAGSRSDPSAPPRVPDVPPVA